MKVVLSVICYSLYILSANAQKEPPGGYYTTRYDHIDVENILNQKRLVYYYTECLMDRGPCTPQGIEFKRILPEALRTNCLRCTEKQRYVTVKSIRRLKKEYPDVWAQLSAAWDPTGEYVKRLEESVNKYNRITPTAAASNINEQAPVLPPEGLLSNRFGEEENTDTSSQPNLIANKPVSFSTSSTTQKPVQITTTTTTTTIPPTRRTTTEKPIVSSILPSVTTKKTTVVTPKKITINLPTTTNSPVVIKTTLKQAVVPNRPIIEYNYDFSVTSRPAIQKPVNGLEMVLKNVNTLIVAPITDIAGKVIATGTDIAGSVLNALGLRKTYNP